MILSNKEKTLKLCNLKSDRHMHVADMRCAGRSLIGLGGMLPPKNFLLSTWFSRLLMHLSGASPGFGGGARIFFLDLGICMSRSGMLRMAKPCALLGGFGGMLPRENFLKRCNLVRFRV